MFNPDESVRCPACGKEPVCRRTTEEDRQRLINMLDENFDGHDEPFHPWEAECCGYKAFGNQRRAALKFWRRFYGGKR